MTEDNVCSEYFERFPKSRKDIKNEERVEFMLSHPTIRSKLDEWIEGGKSGRKDTSTVALKKKTNVTNQLIEPDGEDDTSKDFIRSSEHIKKSEDSTLYREKGNALFKQKKLYESLQSYNQAIRNAHFSEKNQKAGNTSSQDEDELLSLSLANRSAVYFELGKNYYERALQDADLALNNGYPDRLKSKLLLRKANIYVKRKEWNLAQNMIQELQDMNNKVEEPNILNPETFKRIQEIESLIENGKESDIKENVITNSKMEEKRKNMEDNESFENASTSLTLQFSKKSTRYVTTTKDLKKGDIVFEEEPFVSVLLPQFYESHCHFCHRMLDQDYFFPCQQCTQVKFCSESCSKSSWEAYHREECLSLDLLQSVGIAHLAIRLVITAKIPAILEALKKHEFLTDPQNLSIFSKGHSKYEKVYSLLDHSNEICLEDAFQYTLSSSFLTNWLFKKTSFFLNYDDVQPKILSKIGGVILRHICQLICNAHAITDILTDINVERVSLSTAEESQERVASAIFPAASMMNHSCDPNIAFGFLDGKKLIVKLTRNVSNGTEIFNCYGPHFRRMGVSKRQEVLEGQYFFECHCSVCQQEIQSKTSFVETFSSFKCERCEGPVKSPDPEESQEQTSSICLECGYIQDLRDFMSACMYANRLMQDAEVLLERGKVDQALKMLESCHAHRVKVLHKFHTDLGQDCDMIARCYAIKGEFGKAAEFVKKSLVYVEERFGSESIEYGREVKKYSELLMKVDGDNYNDEIQKLTTIYQTILKF